MYIILKFYSNGKPKSSLLTNGKPFYGTNQSHLMIHIPQYNKTWSGDYTIASYVHCDDLASEFGDHGCSSDGDIFLCAYFNIQYVLLSILQMSITDTGKVKMLDHKNEYYMFNYLCRTTFARNPCKSLHCSEKKHQPCYSHSQLFS